MPSRKGSLKVRVSRETFAALASGSSSSDDEDETATDLQIKGQLSDEEIESEDLKDGIAAEEGRLFLTSLGRTMNGWMEY